MATFISTAGWSVGCFSQAGNKPGDRPRVGFVLGPKLYPKFPFFHEGEN
jgi:hypothetical protein